MGKKWKQCQVSFSWAPKSLQTLTAARGLRHLLLGRIAMTKLVAVFVRSASHVQLFATPWTAACQASLSLTISQSLSVSFPMSHLFASDDHNTGVSALVSFLPANIQGWSPLRLTCLICLLIKQDFPLVCCPRDFQESSPAPQFKGINSLVLCFLYGPALTTLCDHWEDHTLDYYGSLSAE